MIQARSNRFGDNFLRWEGPSRRAFFVVSAGNKRSWCNAFGYRKETQIVQVRLRCRSPKNPGRSAAGLDSGFLEIHARSIYRTFSENFQRTLHFMVDEFLRGNMLASADGVICHRLGENLQVCSATAYSVYLKNANNHDRWKGSFWEHRVVLVTLYIRLQHNVDLLCGAKPFAPVFGKGCT